MSTVKLDIMRAALKRILKVKCNGGREADEMQQIAQFALNEENAVNDKPAPRHPLSEEVQA